MEFIRGLHNLKAHHRGCALTIGNFDGVHQGHRAMLAQLKARARELGVPATVLIFEPQPFEYFAPERAPARLTRMREKLERFDDLGVDRVVCVRFDARFAALSADAFVQQMLLDALGVRHVLVGDDFRYGAGRGGDFASLAAAGARHGFGVERMESFVMEGERVSSTAVREALARGDLDKARRFLGWPYHVCGRVAHGDKRGRSIGFPTANIHLHRKNVPLEGVFVVQMHGVAERPWPGVANIGVRPTVDGTRALLEVHLFDFAQEIYGRQVEIEFLHKLRPEQRFESLEALKRQIELDARAARAYFAAQRG
ncbi:MAG: bifunctional riboflavin kinase/FAD synthetase [Thiohalomonadaceae bacterium]